MTDADRIEALVEIVDEARAERERLRALWPHHTKFEKRCFEMLRAAYAKARYSRHYRITAEELAWLTERVETLWATAREICEAHLQSLRREAGEGAG